MKHQKFLFLPVLLLLLLLLLPPVAHATGQAYWISLATRVIVFSIAVVSLDLVLGHAGLPSFGHAAFFGLGGFTVAILAQQTHDLNPTSWFYAIGQNAVFSWSVAVLVTSVAGALIGALALRTRGVHFLMITLAFSQMVYFVFVGLPSYGGDEGLRLKSRQKLFGYSLEDSTVFYYVCAALLIFIVALIYLIVHSRFGRVLAGCRQNERRMRFLGYRTGVYLWVAFVISAAGTGAAGALMANLQRYVSPHSLSWFQSGEFMVMNILGGLASTFGGILGTAVFVILHEFLVSYTAHWEIIFGIGLLILVLFRPGGLLRAQKNSGADHG